jgi:hypothetical protein
VTRSALALALALALGCSRGADAPSNATPGGGAPPELQRALSDAIVARAAAEAAALNADAYLSDLKKYDRIFEGLEIYRRIPERWDEAAFRAALEAHLLRHRLKLAAFTARERTEERRALPAAVPASEGLRYQPADLRAVVDLGFTVTPNDRARLRRWFDDRAALGPLLHLSAIRSARGGAEVRAEAYHFLLTALPRYTATPPDVEAALRRAGVTEPLAALRAGPHAALLREIESEYTAATAVHPRVEAGLQRVAESHLREARYDLFKERVAAVENQSFDDVLMK